MEEKELKQTEAAVEEPQAQETDSEATTETQTETAEATAETTAEPAATEEPTAEEAAPETPVAEAPIEEATPETSTEGATAEPVAENNEEAPATEETPAEEAPAVEEKPAEPETPKVAHDDFDWEIESREVEVSAERKALEDQYEDTLTIITENEIIDGIVVSITDSDVVFNIGFKSDGLVSVSEFRDLPDLKVGDAVPVYVETLEDKNGQLVLSRKKAKLLRAWENIVSAHKEDTVVTGNIISKTKGGLIVDVFGLETFLPGSQIDVKPIIDYDQYVGKKMEFKVVKVNEQIKNAVVSHKALIESDIESQRQEIISKLEKGQVLEGIVKNITDFGAFIDLGGVDGLLYITDISWGRINHPSEVLEINQNIKVVILDFDMEKRRISLGLKQLTEHPWDKLVKTVSEGSKITGKVVNIEDYGAFLEIEPGVEGLVHISEVSWSNQPISAREFFKTGAEHEAMIVTIDKEERKMSLSIRQLTEDPWEKITEKYPVGSKHTGVVRNLTPYGVFVELDENIGGMVHISDLSWLKRYNHPSDFVKVNDNLEAVVLDIDMENRKISLGHKQIEEDPWDTFEDVFPVGSEHDATVIRREDKGAIVSLPYGLEGFVPTRHLKKEDGRLAEVDETLIFRVIEFDRDAKRIVVSHTRYVAEKEREDRMAKDDARVKESRDARRKVQEVNKRVEKTTLGDLGALSQLKQQLQEAEKGGGTKAKPAAKKAAPKKAAAKKEEAPVKEEETKEAEAVVEEVKEEKPKAKKKATTKKKAAKEEAPKEEPKAEAETEAKEEKSDDAAEEAK